MSATEKSHIVLSFEGPARKLVQWILDHFTMIVHLSGLVQRGREELSWIQRPLWALWAFLVSFLLSGTITALVGEPIDVGNPLLRLIWSERNKRIDNRTSYVSHAYPTSLSHRWMSNKLHSWVPLCCASQPLRIQLICRFTLFDIGNEKKTHHQCKNPCQGSHTC